ncbi:MAG: energy transducer TonB [Thermodesulfovibrionales bacterium]|nr:energy transducer TonB [Thermodesulfovibrionales bacterium]
MNYQFRSLQVSIVIHALLFVSVFNISSLFPASKLMVIDFSLEDSMNAAGQKAEVRNQRPEIIEQKQEIEKPERKLSAVIPDNQASDTQAPVQAPVEQKNESASHASNITAENKTALIRTGSNESVNLIDGTARYLKENFSYVREVIQKKISYPRVARQMGWEGKVVVSFIICADGHAKDIKIKEGSGIALLDRNAIETVKKASPFPRPPVEAQLLIPIKYSLN